MSMILRLHGITPLGDLACVQFAMHETDTATDEDMEQLAPMLRREFMFRFPGAVMDPEIKKIGVSRGHS